MPVVSPTLLIVPSISVHIPTVAHSWTPEEHLSSSPAKEHVENVIWIEFLLVEAILLLIPLLEALLTSMLIIKSTFVLVIQTRERGINLLECLVSLRRFVLIRVKLQCQLLVSLLKLFLCGFFSEPENLIVVLLGNDILAFFDLKMFKHV
jgi:hypothetical protein